MTPSDPSEISQEAQDAKSALADSGLWKALGNRRSVEPSPDFAKRVLHEIQRTRPVPVLQQWQQMLASWFPLPVRLTAATAALIALAIVVFLPLSSQGPMLAEAEDFEVILELDHLLAHEETNQLELWLDLSYF
jgi:hypothetical protein